MRRLAVRRLSLALGLSLLVHLALMFGPAIPLPASQPVLVLEATLVQAPPPSPPAPILPKHKPARKRSAPVPLPPAEMPSPAPEETLPIAEETAPSPLPSAAPGMESASESPIPLPEQAAIRYTLYKGRNGLAVGQVIQEWRREDRHYTINQVAEASGIFSLFVSGRHVQISQGDITPHGLRPVSYWVQRGQKADKTDSARFDWQKGSLTFGTGLETRTVTLPPGTQDLLSLLYQFAFAPPGEERTELHVTTGRKLGRYGYQRLGEETVETGQGDVHTLHIGQGRGDGEENTEIWLATEYHYLPVKIRFTDKQGGVMEQTMTAIEVK